MERIFGEGHGRGVYREVRSWGPNLTDNPFNDASRKILFTLSFELEGKRLNRLSYG